MLEVYTALVDGVGMRGAENMQRLMFVGRADSCRQGVKKKKLRS